MSLSSRQKRASLSIRPSVRSICLAAEASWEKPGADEGRQFDKWEGRCVRVRGAPSLPLSPFHSKPPHFYHMTVITIRSQRHRSARLLFAENDRVISLQTVKGAEGPVLQARSSERKRQMGGMRKETFPLSWTLNGSRRVQAAKRMWGENCTGTLSGSSDTSLTHSLDIT